MKKGDFWLATSLQVAGIALLTVAAGAVDVGTVAETCTQNAADSLGVGYFAIPIYILCFWPLVRKPLPPICLPLLIPAIVAIAYQVWWTAVFGFEYVIRSKPVCDLITGVDDFDFDGREPIYLTTWSIMSLLAMFGIALSVMRSVRAIRSRSV